ncbi:MAG: glutathione peroxidase [Candidatus Eisenbacteria bacterium]
MPLHPLALFTIFALGLAAVTGTDAGARPLSTVYDFKARTIGGDEISLSQYKGKVLLIVNTASRCGFTPQYKDLEAVYRSYRAKGFEVLAFPANNFMHQEPGSDAEIQKFCSLRYDTTFPLFSKISVKGRDIHPLYAYLTHDTPYPGAVRWNFNKFLVGPDGHVAARFDSKVSPTSPKVKAAIEGLLSRR